MSRSSEGVELTEHPADIGIRCWAPTRERTLELACLGLMRIMTDPEDVEKRHTYEVSVEPGAERDVLRRALSEVLFLMSSENLFFSSFEARWAKDSITIICHGEPIDPDEHERYTEVKAITPSGLSFSNESGSWVAQVLVDV